MWRRVWVWGFHGDSDHARARTNARAFYEHSRLQAIAGIAREVRWFQWWPLLLGVAGIAFTYAAKALGWQAVLSKHHLETLALVLTIAATAVFSLRAWFWPEPLYTILTALSVSFMCREFHWDWTGDAIYAALVVVVLWSYAWRDRIVPFLALHRSVFVWLTATAAAYFLSQFIARRAFRQVLPNEQAMHVALEEIAETVAHTMLLVLALAPRIGDGEHGGAEDGGAGFLV